MSFWEKVVNFFEKRISLNELLSFITSLGIFYTPICHNKPVKEAIKDAMETPSPSYARWPYILGILTFILFIFQIVTGLLLLFYYIPSKEGAYVSTVSIIRDKPFGFFIFNIHHWSAILLLSVIISRLIRFAYHKVFSPPREIFWIIAYFLFLFIAFAYVTGSVLPMDAEAGWVSYRLFEIIYPIPIVGKLYKVFLGAGNLNDTFILRSYVFHVVIIPLIIFFLFYVHFLSVRKVGLSFGKYEGKSVFPGYFFEILFIIFITFAVLFTLAGIFPREIFAPFLEYKNYTGFNVPFVFLFFDFLRTNLSIFIYSILGFLLLLIPIFLPWIDKTPPIPLIKKPFTFVIYSLFFLVILFISIMEYIR